MTDFLNIRIQGSKGIVEGVIEDAFDVAKARRLLREAVKDIGDAIEHEVNKTVPEETGALKLHPFDRDDTRTGIVSTGPAFGGQRSVQGAGGRFVGAVPVETPVGSLVARTVFTLPKKPLHAKFVHEGTGRYGPTGEDYFVVPPKYMIFPRWSKARDRRPVWKLSVIRGQRRQPYLENAYLLINSTYVPARIGLLRTQLATQT